MTLRSDSSGVHLIAEAGTNHGGDLGVARQLVDVAAESGADSVKFQVIYPEGLYLPTLRGPDGSLTPNEVFEKRRAAMLSDDDYRRLAEHARKRSLPLSASIFDERGLRLLEELDAPYVKIASCDLDNSRLLRAAAATGRTLVVSTGMSSLAEVEQAVADLTAAGPVDLVLLHCVSVYPCPVERMNVGFLTTLASAFGFPVGLSDHTESNLAAAMAIALGATVVEKHFTLDRSAEGFDHAYAMEPGPFRGFAAALRACSQALRPVAEGDKVGAAEASVRQRARRALYAARAFEAGHVLTEADVLVVRPAGPLAPNQLGEVLGRRLRAPVAQFQPLTFELF